MALGMEVAGPQYWLNLGTAIEVALENVVEKVVVQHCNCDPVALPEMSVIVK